MQAIVNDILNLLEADALIESTRIVSYDETPSGKLEARIRSQLPKKHVLQIWIQLEPESLDYAYQLFTTIPLLRWDNAPHYDHLTSAPHHFHDEQGDVTDSPLTGNVKRDLRIVLGEVRKWMKAQK